ncbi:MAG: hypothetical protein AB1755_05200 [Candidatus Omnitrophota bacterium]
MIKKIFTLLLAGIFCFNNLCYGFQNTLTPGPVGEAFTGFSGQPFRPIHLRYLSYLPDTNNFKLFLDKGSINNPSNKQIQSETKNLLNYFFVGLALPNKTFWVNLRPALNRANEVSSGLGPNEQNNVIDERLAQTDVGRILLEADVQLKQDTAKLTSPKTKEGKEYWNKLFIKAKELQQGATKIKIPTLLRPWIVPDEIIIAENKGSCYVYKATMKVMLEAEHRQLPQAPSLPKRGIKGEFDSNQNDKILNDYSAQLIKELIIPKLNKEINSSKRYAALRQVYYSLIIAQWFKERHKDKLKIDSGDLTNLTSKTPWSIDAYYRQYEKSFKEGEYNIKEVIPTAKAKIIRTYTSGGAVFNISQIPQVGERAVDPITGSSVTCLPAGDSLVPEGADYLKRVSVSGDQVVVHSKDEGSGQIARGYSAEEIIQIEADIRQDSETVKAAGQSVVGLVNKRAARIISREAELRRLLEARNIPAEQVKRVFACLRSPPEYFNWFNARAEFSNRYFLGSNCALAVNLIWYLFSQEGQAGLPKDLIDEYILHEALENIPDQYLDHYAAIGLTQQFFNRGKDWQVNPIAQPDEDKSNTVLGRVVRGFIETNAGMKNPSGFEQYLSTLSEWQAVRVMLSAKPIEANLIDLIKARFGSDKERKLNIAVIGCGPTLLEGRVIRDLLKEQYPNIHITCVDSELTELSDDRITGISRLLDDEFAEDHSVEYDVVFWLSPAVTNINSVTSNYKKIMKPDALGFIAPSLGGKSVDCGLLEITQGSYALSLYKQGWFYGREKPAEDLRDYDMGIRMYSRRAIISDLGVMLNREYSKLGGLRQSYSGDLTGLMVFSTVYSADLQTGDGVVAVAGRQSAATLTTVSTAERQGLREAANKALQELDPVKWKDGVTEEQLDAIIEAHEEGIRRGRSYVIGSDDNPARNPEKAKAFRRADLKAILTILMRDKRFTMEEGDKLIRTGVCGEKDIAVVERILSRSAYRRYIVTIGSVIDCELVKLEKRKIGVVFLEPFYQWRLLGLCITNENAVIINVSACREHAQNIKEIITNKDDFMSRRRFRNFSTNSSTLNWQIFQMFLREFGEKDIDEITDSIIRSTREHEIEHKRRELLGVSNSEGTSRYAEAEITPYYALVNIIIGMHGVFYDSDKVVNEGYGFFQEINKRLGGGFIFDSDDRVSDMRKEEQLAVWFEEKEPLERLTREEICSIAYNLRYGTTRYANMPSATSVSTSRLFEIGRWRSFLIPLALFLGISIGNKPVLAEEQRVSQRVEVALTSDITKPDGIESIRVAELEKLSLPIDHKYKFYQVSDEDIFHIEFATTGLQDDAFFRLSVFTESDTNAGNVLDDRRLKEAYDKGEEKKGIGYDFRIEDICKFYTQAKKKGIVLNDTELKIKDDLLRFGFMKYTNGKYVPSHSKTIAIISVAQDSPERGQVVRHEFRHGLYFTEPFIRDGVKTIWDKVDPDEQYKLIRIMNTVGGYNPNNIDLILNELYACLLGNEIHPRTDTMVHLHDYFQDLEGKMYTSRVIVGNEVINTLERLSLKLRAEEVLGRTVSDTELDAIVKAHLVGKEKGHCYVIDPDGRPAKHPNPDKAYTPEEIRQKAHILKAAGFSEEERERLIREGVCGEEDKPTTVTELIEYVKEKHLSGSLKEQYNQGLRRIIAYLQSGESYSQEQLDFERVFYGLRIVLGHGQMPIAHIMAVLRAEYDTLVLRVDYSKWDDRNPLIEKFNNYYDYFLAIKHAMLIDKNVVEYLAEYKAEIIKAIDGLVDTCDKIEAIIETERESHINDTRFIAEYEKMQTKSQQLRTSLSFLKKLFSDEVEKTKIPLGGLFDSVFNNLSSYHTGGRRVERKDVVYSDDLSSQNIYADLDLFSFATSRIFSNTIKHGSEKPEISLEESGSGYTLTVKCKKVAPSVELRRLTETNSHFNRQNMFLTKEQTGEITDYSDEDAGKGLGMDLLWQIIQMHGGGVNVVYDEAENSLVYTITLPKRDTTVANAPEEPGGIDGSTGSPLGGIDFTNLPIVTQAIDNLTSADVTNIIEVNLTDKQKTISSIAKILRQEEEQYIPTNLHLRDILIVLTANLSQIQLRQIFLRKN